MKLLRVLLEHLIDTVWGDATCERVVCPVGHGLILDGTAAAFESFARLMAPRQRLLYALRLEYLSVIHIS